MNIWTIFGKVDIDSSGATEGLANVRSDAKATGDTLERDVTQKANDSSKKLQQWGQGLRSFGLGLSAAVTTPLIAMGGVGLRSAAQLETFSESLKVMLGDADKAAGVFDELYEFSATTPFDWPTLTEATTKLAGFGVEAENILPLLRDMGDISAGLNTPLTGLADIYGKVLVNGKASMEEINRLAERGVPIYDELASVLGVTRDKVRDMVSDGEVNAEHLRQAFENLTGEGGRFGGMMEAISNTTVGKWAALRDSFEQVTDAIGERLLPVANRLLDWAAEVINRFTNLDERTQNVILTVTGVVAALGPLLAGFGQVMSIVGGAGGVTAALGGLRGAMALFTGPAGLILVIAGLLLNELASAFGGWGNLLEAAKGWLMDFIEKAKPLFDKLVELASTALAALRALWDTVLYPLLVELKPFFEGVLNAIGIVLDTLIAAVGGVVDALSALLKGDLVGVFNGLASAAEAIFSGLHEVVVTILTGLTQAVYNLASGIVNGLIEGLTNGMNAVKDTVTGLANNIVGWFKGILGIESPSTIFSGFGGNIVQGLLNGITGMLSAAKNTVTGFANNVWGWFKDTLGIHSPSTIFEGGGVNIVDGLTAGINNEAARGRLKNAVTGMGHDLSNWFWDSLPDQGGSGAPARGTKGDRNGGGYDKEKPQWQQAIDQFSQGVLDLATEKIPALGAALEGFAQGGIWGAISNVLLSLLGETESFGLIMEAVNRLLEPIVGVLDSLLKALMPIIQVALTLVEVALKPLAWILEKIIAPVFKFVGSLIAGIYNAIATAINWALGWAGVHLPLIDLNGGGSSPTTPPPTSPSPLEPPQTTGPQRDGRNGPESVSFDNTPQSVQLGIATPLAEASRVFMDAALIMRDALGGLVPNVLLPAGVMTADMNIVGQFTDVLIDLVPVLRTLITEGVDIHMSERPVTRGRSSSAATDYLRVGSFA